TIDKTEFEWADRLWQLFIASSTEESRHKPSAFAFRSKRFVSLSACDRLLQMTNNLHICFALRVNESQMTPGF
ncbi:MAG: hypothetical protein AAFY11_14700, partial [Cyanobacteria bacterium J06641_5]